MVRFLSSLLALAAVTVVSGGIINPSRFYKHAIIARKDRPAGYNETYLEPYQQYHARYLAIGCENHHHEGTFFNQCCHPMLATETLDTARPPQCHPSSSASASAAIAEPTSTVTTPADGDKSGDGQSDTQTPTSTSSDHQPSPSTKSDVKQDPPPPPPAPSPSHPPQSHAGGGGGGAPNTGGFATFFFQKGNAGACGQVHSDSDIICAIDSERYNNGALCGKQVQITNTKNGQTVTATVADECPTCDNGNSIDLSTGAFNHIADQSEGLVPISWIFV